MTIEELETQFYEISAKIRLYEGYRSILDAGRLIYYIKVRERVLLRYERLLDGREGNCAVSDSGIGSDSCSKFRLED